jgi:hypothetical protein
MKKFALAICLLFATTICAHAKTPPNPADYTITVHVTGVHQRQNAEYLDVMIDGRRYELCTYNYYWIFDLGDYKARIIKDEKTPYGFNRTYEFLLPNKTQQFSVVGIPDPALLPSKE